MKLDCIVIEDDVIQRMINVKLVNSHPNLNVVGSFSNAKEAKDFISKNSVDLILLDIEMPVVNGFAFLADLKSKFGKFFLIPEGGTNMLAIKGCQEILTQQDSEFDYVCCAVGTAGTISGIINSVLPHQKVLGFPALKGDFLQDEIRIFVQNQNWELITDYHFGGYGKVNENLIHFINRFYIENQIPLDPVYTGKMVFGVMDLIQKDYFPAHSNILLIHTGGLQGIYGMNERLKNKQLPTIAIDV